MGLSAWLIGLRLTRKTGRLPGQIDPAAWDIPGLRSFLLSDGLGLIGSYFYQIALPGLVLELGGSAADVGLTILLSGVSRIGLMIFGGALSDAFSPKLLLMAANLARLGLVLALAGLAASSRLSLGVLMGFNLAFGITEAIGLPSRATLLPGLVQSGQLQRANVMAAGQEKLIGMLGPAAAGAIVFHATIWLNSPVAVSAFIIQALALSTSLLFLRSVRPDSSGCSDKERGQKTPAAPLNELVRLIRLHKHLGVSILMVLAVNGISIGPLCIGLPILAISRFTNSAGALGILMSASSGGALLGAILPELLPRPPSRHILPIILGVIGLSGAGLFILFTAEALISAALAALMVGMLLAYVNVIGVTQVQLNTPPAFMGRVMGVLNLK